MRTKAYKGEGGSILAFILQTLWTAANIITAGNCFQSYRLYIANARRPYLYVATCGT